MGADGRCLTCFVFLFCCCFLVGGGGEGGGVGRGLHRYKIFQQSQNLLTLEKWLDTGTLTQRGQTESTKYKNSLLSLHQK